MIDLSDHHQYDPHRLATAFGWCANSECPIEYPDCEGIGVPIYATPRTWEVEVCETCDRERKKRWALEREANRGSEAA